MWRLIADFVRHRWPLYALVAAAAAILFARLIPLPFTFAMSVELALVAGPLNAFSVSPKEVRLLPLSRRDISRASWWLVLIGVAAVSAGKLVAALLPGASHGLSPATIALSTLFDLSNAAAFLAVPSLMVAFDVPAKSRMTRTLLALMGVLYGLAFLGGAVWMLYWYGALPTTWKDLGQAGWLGAVAAFACITPLVVRTIASQAGVVRFDPDDPITLAPSRVSPSPFARWPGANLTGLRRLFLMHWAKHTAGLIAVLGVLAIFCLFLGRPSGRQVSALEIFFLPFLYARNAEEALVRLVLPAIIVLGSSSNLLWAVRSLRALPLSTHQLAWLPIVLALFDWATLVAILLGIHVAAVGNVPSPVLLAPLLIVAAVSVTGVSVQWRWGQHRMPWAILAIGVPTFFVQDIMSMRTLCAVSTFAIVLAGLFNYLTLTTSRAPYKATRAARPV